VDPGPTPPLRPAPDPNVTAAPAGVGEEVLAAVGRLVGADVELVGATARGESRSAFRLRSGAGDLVLKLVPDRPGALDDQHRLVRLVDRLRRRGYPAPEHLGAGRAGGTVFTVQRRLPGRMLEPAPGQASDPAVLARVVPAVLDAVELQRDAGDLPRPPWPRWLLETIETGGDGYCLHETMRRRADTAALLRRLVELARRHATGTPRTTDVLHFDLNPANILHEDGRLTGVVDWTVPFAGAAQGDRGFDVATLLFYTYELDATRHLLWSRAAGISGVGWVVVYLCHLVLRQVEWTVRHRPGSAEESRFLAIAERVLDDCA
jgi:aminoglycoside phosphotransferase (APT) family kinase protein